MHKRNIALLSLALAGIVVALFFLYPESSHPTFLHLLYAPAILLTILLSESIHSPSVISVWANLVIFTLMYWIIFWVLIAFSTELLMIRRSLHHVRDKEDHDLAEIGRTKKWLQPPLDHLLEQQAQEEAPGPEVKAEMQMYFEQFGRALKEIEERRRRNFLLQNIDVLNLDEPYDVLAKHAISKAGNKRSVKALLDQMESTLTTRMGSRDAARHFIEMLKHESSNFKAT